MDKLFTQRLAILLALWTGAAFSAPPDSVIDNLPAISASVSSISGSASGDDPIDEVKLTILDEDFGYYWNGSAFQTNPVEVSATLSGSGNSVNWSYNFSQPLAAGVYSVSSVAVDNQNLTQSSPDNQSFSITHYFTSAGNGSWGPVIQTPSIPVAAANLPDGKILHWAAYKTDDYKPSSGDFQQTYTSIFDPVTGQSTLELIDETNHDMFCMGANILEDGRVLMNGGNSHGLTSIFDNFSGNWVSADPMNIPRAYQGNAMLEDGRILTLGGSWKFSDLCRGQTDHSGTCVDKKAEVWDPDTDSWSVLDNISPYPLLLTDDIDGLFRSDNHMWLFSIPGGKVLHAGPSRSMHLLDVSGNGSITPVGNRADDADAMNGNAVMYDVGKILTVGGAPNYENDDATSSAFVIEASGNSVSARRVSNMASARAYHNSVVLPNGEIIVVGGQDYPVIFSDAGSVYQPELWNPLTETFRALAPMQVARTYHSVALLTQDGRVLAGGGGLCGTCQWNHSDVEIFTPPYLYNSDGNLAQRPTILSAPTSTTYGNVITVRTDSPISSLVLMRASAVTHSVNNAQRRIPLDFTVTTNNNNLAVIPNDSGSVIPGNYMLFALDEDGVPSVATSLNVRHDPDNQDTDGDGIPDSEDPFPLDPDNDIDGDNISGHIDNCPVDSNPSQADTDNDGIGDACDDTDNSADAEFSVQLMDNRFDVCIEVNQASTVNGANVQTSPCTSSPVAANQIFDFIPVSGLIDTHNMRPRHSGLCVAVENGSGSNSANIMQETCSGSVSQQFRIVSHGDTYAVHTGTGSGAKLLDASATVDSDGVRNLIQWTDQAKGNQRWTFLLQEITTPVDNADSDGDGILDTDDDFPLDPDNDIDGDGISGHIDNCPDDSNEDQNDADGDGIGNVCDTSDDRTDSDGDGVLDIDDAFPLDPDNDIDGDDISGHIDNCPNDSNEDQSDSDNDGIGDACDTSDDSPEQPDDSDFSAQLKDNRFDVCIEVDAASTQSGANVQAAECSTIPVDDHQIFDFVLNSGSNIYNIRPRHSALCLEVDAGSPNNRANIQQASCNNSAEQQFSVSPDGDTFAIYTNTGNGSKVLDASATVDSDGVRNLIQWTDQAKGNQRWTFLLQEITTPVDNADSDGDGILDTDDDFPLDPDNDIDGDGISGHIDNCPDDSNEDQNDADGDGIGNVCDTSDDRTDSDGDGVLDIDDAFPLDPDNDIDGDDISGHIDNCPNDSNEDQSDSDNDGIGDACDTSDDSPEQPDDSDFSAQLKDNRFDVCIEVDAASTQSGANVQAAECSTIPVDDHQIFDFVLNSGSNIYNIRPRHSALCLEVDAGSPNNRANIQQASCNNSAEQQFSVSPDGDTFAIYTNTGNGSKVLDASATVDSDGVRNLIQWTDQAKGNQRWTFLLQEITTPVDNADSDGDGILDTDDDFPLDPDNDIDGDGISGHIDNCPDDSNEDQNDADGDGIGNVCDTSDDRTDSDGDGVLDIDDAFPLDPDNDIDGDDISGHIDNCPNDSNEDQSDSDNDGIGDACDTSDDSPEQPDDSDFSAQLKDNRFDVCIEVDAASTQSGANVQAAECSTIPVDDHQIFDFVLNSGSNIYNIRPRHSALCLEVDAGSPNNRANIQQASCNNSAEQQFSVSPDGDTFAIYTNTGNGSKVLDASATVDSDGVRNLIQWTDQAKGNQRWTFLLQEITTPVDNTDSDGDGILDTDDDFPLDPDNDIDGDGISGHIDNCPDDSNEDQNDADGDGIGNVCDTSDDRTDSDGDGVLDIDDAFPLDPDNDIDGDDISGHIDNCPNDSNEDQSDSDNDGIGDACDTSDDSPEQPDDSDFSAQLKDNRFDVCIEVDAASTQSGANVQAAECSTIPVDDHQIFDFVLNSGSNIYNIRPRHSALCLEVDAGSPNNRANIQQASCNNSAEQQFSVSPDGDTFAIYTNTGNGSKVLDASATVDSDGVRNLIQWTDQAKGNQRWTLIDHGTLPPVDITSPLKIMAIGDSITQGTKGEESYRPKFVTLLEETSCNFEMVGSRKNINPPPHEGYSGHRVEHFINGGTFNSITNPGVTAMLNAENPDVVFIHLGTNDIRRGDSATDTVTELEELVNIIDSQTNSNAQIFVANVVPWYQDLDGGGINDDETPAMNQYKDAIELSLADTSPGKLGSYPNVILVDVHTGFEYTDMHFDGTAYEGLHPGPDGELRIAQAFYDAFTLVDACANSQ